MSHIANKIIAKDIALSDAFTNSRYRIDAFQRDYRWQHKQIDALISDLSTSFFSNYETGNTLANVDKYDSYYMGPIVLCEDEGYLSVVDGQQRLTSFSLLLIFLQHLQKSLTLSDDCYRDLSAYIFITKGGKRTFTLDVSSRNKVMRGLFELNSPDKSLSLSDDDETDRDSLTNLIACYDDIRHIFPNELKKADVLPLFIEWLLLKVVLVEIRAFSMDNAYTIFETMNDRGLSLNPTEILKAYVLSKITDENQSEEMNDFWKQRVSRIKYKGGSEADMSFFRAWFRAKYADTIRQGQSGEDFEDYEQIGSRFHTWFKNNQKRFHLSKSDDFYYFVKGDFDFFSQLFIDIIDKTSNEGNDKENLFYVSACYPMADSLYMSLMMSAVMARDSKKIISDKLNLVNRFVDIFLNRRTLSGKSVTQSSIRRKVFEITKKIRNASITEVHSILTDELSKLESASIIPIYNGFAQSYMHYVLARVRFQLGCDLYFESLLRTRKQSSYVLCQIFSEEEWDTLAIGNRRYSCWSLINYCLCRRQVGKNLPDDPHQRLNYLISNNCLPELKGVDLTMDNFADKRYETLEENVAKIWPLYIRLSEDNNSSSETLVSTINKSIEDSKKLYINPNMTGSVSFDYSANDGLFVIGSGDYSFTTMWTTAGQGSIHCYKDYVSLLGFNSGYEKFPAMNEIADFDFSSRAHTIREGEIVILQNSHNKFAAIKVNKVKCNKSDQGHLLEFEYKIYTTE